MLIKFRIIFLFLFIISIWICSSQENNSHNGTAEYALADKYYIDAGKLDQLPVFNDAAELKQEELNRKALSLFKVVIANQHTSDSILFHSYVKAGLLENYFDSLAQAKEFYLKALNLQARLPQLADSFFFKPSLFAGGIFYSQNKFDTALIYYKRAEQITENYSKPLENIERLYNRMGVMYYETGNYRLSNNYFQKAISSLSASNPAYQDLLINYKMNMASIMINLEDYDRSAAIFQSIIPLNVYPNEINHNLGIINLRQKKYTDALSFFRKVNYGKAAKNIDLYSNMAEAFLGSGQKDSAIAYINRAIAENQLYNGSRKNLSMGMLLKLSGDEKISNGNIADALRSYQQAIGHFYPAFIDADIHSVPSKFNAVFSYVPLFNTLIAKAAAFEKQYTQTNNITDIESSFAAYKSAFDLSDHIAKTYSSDEARLFLNKIKYSVHDQAIKNSLKLYEITHKKEYLEGAWLIDQRNKAASLALALQENNIQQEAGIASTVSSRQESLRAEITRLSLKASHISDSTELSAISRDITDKEIGLSKIQEQMNNDPAYSILKAADHIPASGAVQKMLDDQTVLLSYHLSETELLVFIINKQGFSYIKQPIDSLFFNNLEIYTKALHNLDQSERYSGASASLYLYNILIKPLLPLINKSNRLVIIPDDELNYIAFEALQDGSNNYLLSSFAIQYQYSASLLHLTDTKPGAEKTVLAFAPFAENGLNGFQKLSHSKEEVSGLNGKVFMDSSATKKQFMQYANKYEVVQLATHAVAYDSAPQRSFIAFYPVSKTSNDENILYAQEIQNMRLDSTRLIILSACETGTGQLVRGEGLMSISRAFAYAGCPNIITSLWKASDKTTAFITKRLHDYLDKGKSRDIALQQAKLDLLNSNEISPSLKTPNYWAHLVLIGNYEPADRSFPWLWLIAGAAVLLLLYLLFKKKSRNK